MYIYVLISAINITLCKYGIIDILVYFALGKTHYGFMIILMMCHDNFIRTHQFAFDGFNIVRILGLHQFLAVVIKINF